MAAEQVRGPVGFHGSSLRRHRMATTLVGPSLRRVVHRRAAPWFGTMSGTDGDIAERMASNQKQVAISEFFEKNKHFLGFDNPARSLITAVKEAVDNSLDAAEEAQILPDIIVRIHRVPKEKELYDLEVEDNGPGIPKNSIEKVFGRLLFGSRFHAIRQSRGQQGIGITGVVMNSMLTSGRPTKVISKIASEDTAVTMDVALDTKRNRANTSNVDRMIWVDDQGVPKAHGLHIRTRMRARFQSGRQSVEQPQDDLDRQSSCRHPLPVPRR